MKNKQQRKYIKNIIKFLRVKNIRFSRIFIFSMTLLYYICDNELFTCKNL